MTLRGPDLANYCCSNPGGDLGGSVTELDASTGAVVKVFSASTYGLNGPDARAFSGSHLFVANYSGNNVMDSNGTQVSQGSVRELDTSTGALVKVLGVAPSRPEAAAPPRQFGGSSTTFSQAIGRRPVVTMAPLGGTNCQAPTGAKVKGNIHVARTVVEGAEALVSVTGRVCTTTGDPTSQCETNTDPDAGLPGGN